MIATTLASAARPFWRLLERHKIDPAYVFREAGLDAALMDKPRERYKLERWAASWKEAADLIEDPCFGLKVAEVWSPTDLHALGAMPFWLAARCEPPWGASADTCRS